MEHVLGSAGLATPIRGHDGTVVAALNLGVVTMRYHQRSEELVAFLKDAGRRISLRLGYRGVLTTGPIRAARAALGLRP